MIYTSLFKIFDQTILMRTYFMPYHNTYFSHGEDTRIPDKKIVEQIDIWMTKVHIYIYKYKNEDLMLLIDEMKTSIEGDYRDKVDNELKMMYIRLEEDIVQLLMDKYRTNKSFYKKIHQE